MTTPSTLTVERVRHAPRRRSLQVRRITQLAPRLVRITLAGDELHDFVSASFDDHIKLFFPSAGSAADGTPLPSQMRDYTPRRFDTAQGELDIEFVLHGDGPASGWAEQAKVGDLLEIGGPRGSFIVPVAFDWHLLVGDESALPAIARRLEELAGRSQVLALVEVDDAQSQIPLAQAQGIDVRWLHRNGPGACTLEHALRELVLPDGQGYAWAAGESSVMKSIHRHLTEERGMDKHRIRASSYWRRGAQAVHERLGD
jgi:NADPH-dependent ferric siderophore reductase